MRVDAHTKIDLEEKSVKNTFALPKAREAFYRNLAPSPFYGLGQIGVPMISIR